MIINDPDTHAAVDDAFRRYEAALIGNAQSSQRSAQTMPPPTPNSPAMALSVSAARAMPGHGCPKAGALLQRTFHS